MSACVGICSEEDGRGYVVVMVVERPTRYEVSTYVAPSAFHVRDFFDLLREPISSVAVHPGWERCIVTSATKAGLRAIVLGATSGRTPSERARALAFELLEREQEAA